MTHIISIGTAVPSYQLRQSDILKFMINTFQPSEVEQQRLTNLYERSGIQNRYSVIPDYSPSASEAYLRCGQVEATTEQRMECFRRNSVPLSVDAIKDCMPSHVDMQSITHLITVSGTGMLSSGLDVELANVLGLPKTVCRHAVNFMGCHASFLALKHADMICQTQPNAIVLVVSVELCTLHFQNKYDENNMRANLLFADGAAAVLLTGEKTALKLKKQAQRLGIEQKSLKIKGFYSEIAPYGQEDVGLFLTQTGIRMKLSPLVPQIVQEGIRPLVDTALGRVSMETDEVKQWAVHPGGRKILDVVGKELGLEEDKLAASYRTLSNYGNMSSATILFVLKETWDSQLSWKDSEKVCAVGFGPGLTMETLLLEADLLEDNSLENKVLEGLSAAGTLMEMMA